MISLKIKEINNMVKDNRFQTPEGSKSIKKQLSISKIHTYSSQSKLQEKARPKKHQKRIIVNRTPMSNRKKMKRESAKEVRNMQNTVEEEQIDRMIESNPEESKTHGRKISSCKPPLPRNSSEEREFTSENIRKIKNPEEHIKEIVDQLPIIEGDIYRN